MTPPLKGILVTGATGFLGMHVVQRPLGQGHAVHGIDNFSSYYDPSLKEARLARIGSHKNFGFKPLDITNQGELRQLFTENKFNIVPHLAAQAGVR